MSVPRKQETNWTNVEAGIGAIAFGLIVLIVGWLNAILMILGGTLSALGAGYLLSVPQVRLSLKVAIKWVSRKQVFKNTGTISGSTVVGNVDTGGGPFNYQPTVGAPKTPFLRATVSLVRISGLDEVELEIDVKNIGEGIATDTEGELVLEGGSPVKVLDRSPLNVLPIGPGESGLGRVSGVSDEILQSFANFSLSIRYKDVNGIPMRPFEVKGVGDQLRRKLNDDSWQHAISQYGFK